MMARVLVLILALFVLFGDASSTANPSPSACYCRPVINVAVDGNGQCDLCATNKQLLQEVNDLKKQLETVKNRISQIQPGKRTVKGLCQLYKRQFEIPKVTFPSIGNL